MNFKGFQLADSMPNLPITGEPQLVSRKFNTQSGSTSTVYHIDKLKFKADIT